MRLESLKIGGVLRFEQPVTLPMADLPPGLIAFVGMNGEGKSTMLEAAIAGLYRTFPSREKSILDYTHATDGFIETVFNLEGRGLYRSRLSLDGPHKRSEGVITRMLPDGSEAFVTSDSKVTTYDATIATLLPPLKVLLCSVFAAQNRVGSFATLDKRGRKELFASLFGLDHYQMLSDRARDAGTLVQTALAGALASRETLSRSIGNIDVGLPELARLVQEEQDVIARRTDLTIVLDDLTASMAHVSELAQQHALTLQRRDTLMAESEALTAARATLRAKAKDLDAATARKIGAENAAALYDVEVLETTIRRTFGYNDEVQRIGALLDALVKDADTRIANNRALMDHGQDIRTAAKQMAQLDRAMQVCLDESVAQEIDAARLQESVLNAKALKAELASKDLTRAQADAALLGTVPCGGAGDYASCQFLTNAAIAKERIPALTDEAQTRDQLAHELTSARDLIVRLTDRQRRNTDAFNGLRQERDQKQKIADRLPALERAEEQIAGHEARKKDAAAEAEGQLERARTSETDRIADLREQIARRRAIETARLQGIEADGAQAARWIERDLEENGEKYTEASRALDSLTDALKTTAGASADASRLQGLIKGHHTEWDATTAVLATNKSQQEEIGKQIAAQAAKVHELETLDVNIRSLRQDHLEWTLLQKACGRDGLPMLEIDAAGPTIAAYANDLLQTCGMGELTVELVTQEARASKSKAGETMKETLEMHVYHAGRAGGARDLSDLSGGEQVLVDEALKSAIALVANARNPHPIQTCWRDETTGALHPDVAPKYILMLRRVHDLGKFHQTLFITHNHDVALQADAQVQFADGSVTVALPPY